MGKTSQRRATRRQENDIGCMWGLIRMFYFRRDAKFLLDRKQGSRRHTFSGFAGRHSRKKSRNFEETDEDRDTIEECSPRKPSIKKLMEDELDKVKQLKKIPNEEVQRILADLGHDVCLNKSLMQSRESEGAKNHNTSITMASPSGSLDPSGSKCMKRAEEDDLKLDVADFLGQIYRYHDDCKNKSKLCPEMKSHIHTKLNELNVPHSDLAYKQTPENEEKEFTDYRNPGNSRQEQSTPPEEALEMSSLDNEPFFKTLQRPNSHILENIQKHQKRHVGTKSETRKMLEKSVIVENNKSSKKNELANKTQSKESRHIFFWKKDKSNRRHTSEGAGGSQPVNKIVILKPNPRRWIDPAAATTSACFQQKSFTVQAPEYSTTENSKFSIKEVRRRFRIVNGETAKGRIIAHENGHERDPHGPKDIFTIRKDSRQVPEQTSAQKASATTKNCFRPSNSSTQMQRNDGLGEINNDIITSKDEFVFYEEANKHLTEILKDKSQNAKYPTVQISRSLVGMLSLPQCSTSSPRSSPRVKDCIDLSPEEKNICAIEKAGREELVKERSKPEEDSVSVCGTNEAWDEKADQERHFMEEERAQHGDELHIVCAEEIDKPDCSETICNARHIPVEQHRYNSLIGMMEGAEPGKELVEMFPSSPENVVEKSEHAEPKTPKPSASLELLSQISPKGNHEKQEQPSPVSVLDAFFHEDDDSPDRETIVKCELHQDISRPQYSSDAGSDQEIFLEDRDIRLGYIKTVLELSELCTYQNLEVWYLYDELISPCLFEELHQGNQKNDLKLLFDCICEVITVIQDRYFRNHPCLSFLRHNIQSPPMGQNLISEINKHIEGHLCHRFPSTLHQLINIDLEGCTWMNLRLESEEIVVDIWEFILDGLLEEVTCDIWI